MPLIFPFKKPTSPSIIDDEFESQTLDPKWTVIGTNLGDVDPYASFNTANSFRMDIHKTRKSWLMMQANGAGNHCGINFWISDPDTFIVNTPIIWARMCFSTRDGNVGSAGVDNDGNLGIMLCEGAEDSPDANNRVGVFINEGDGGNRNQVQFDYVNGGAGTVAETTTAKPDHAPWTIVGLIITGTLSFRAFCMNDAGQMYNLGSATIPGTPPPSLGHRNLFIRCTNTSNGAPGNMIVGVDFIRGGSTLP